MSAYTLPAVPPSTIRVYTPNDEVVSTFENYLPHGPPHEIDPEMRPSRSPKLCWIKEGWDYYWYLPKNQTLEGNLVGPLKYRNPKPIQRDQRWYADEGDCNLWRSIDANLTTSINVLGRPLLYVLEHYEPHQATKYGFTRGHKSKEALQWSLDVSRTAIVHRLAYLTYLISRRCSLDGPGGAWREELRTSCGNVWVDSVWEAVRAQCASRNFIGVVVRPLGITSVRNIQAAYKFGVPIWVMAPHEKFYVGIDGGFVVKEWTVTKEQVEKSRLTSTASTDAHRTQPAATPPRSAADHPPANPPQSTRLQPPATTPAGGKWYESWEKFFHERAETSKKRLEEASEIDKQTWKDREDNARGFGKPGKRGAAVYEWEECDSGGFFRILRTRWEVTRDWDHFYRDALVFDAQTYTWDHCLPMCDSAGPPDDIDDDDDRHIMEHSFTESDLPDQPDQPDAPVTLPNDNASPLEFLYSRYGFLSVEPAAPPPGPLIPVDLHLTVGLEPRAHSGERLEHLNSFINSILQAQLPAGHCDLSVSSPPNERFAQSWIHDVVFRSQFPELSDEISFMLLNSIDDDRHLVVHESLSVLQMVRAGTEQQLESQLQHLLHNGSRFTLLYPYKSSLSRHHSDILTFPLRLGTWRAEVADYQGYMSRLKYFFLDRPYVVAAAFSRGGIAWRIAREVLGIEEAIEAVLHTYPNRSYRVNTSRGGCCYHELEEAEWFYLVGGYQVLTGLRFAVCLW